MPAGGAAMLIHDWTRVDAGLFHDFHQDWTIELRRALNAGRLPPGYVALADQQTGGPIPDALTLHRERTLIVSGTPKKTLQEAGLIETNGAKRSEERRVGKE